MLPAEEVDTGVGVRLFLDIRAVFASVGYKTLLVEFDGNLLCVVTASNIRLSFLERKILPN